MLKPFSFRLAALAALLLLSPAALTRAQAPPPASTSVAKPLGILSKDEAGSIMPATVFFRGLTAPIQARNAAGIRFPPDKLLLTALVDTSGYSTGVKQRYQAYLLTELPLLIAGHTLPPGAYGLGFIADNTFVVMDIGNHDLINARSIDDTNLRRPNPLQIVADSSTPSTFRLYSGRSYIPFTVQPDTASQP